MNPGSRTGIGPASGEPVACRAVHSTRTSSPLANPLLGVHRAHRPHASLLRASSLDEFNPAFWLEAIAMRSFGIA